eukprot:GEMP01029973.1.p1 GENE.GEMP01029973.1~~GEMP01029973.1.p1  ORF type:complete len:412 (+),score=96.79 GEMP01029973.1:225-1460(+)
MEFYDLPAQPSAAIITSVYPNYALLKRRYRELARKFHPDKKNTRGVEFFQKIDGVFRELKTLYNEEDGSFKFVDGHANFCLAANGKKVPIFRCLAISVERIRGLKHSGLHQVEFAIAGRRQKSDWVNVRSGQAAPLDFECLFFEWKQEDYLQVVIHFQRGFRYNKRDCETHILIGGQTNFRGWIQLEHKDRKAGEMFLHMEVLRENDLAGAKAHSQPTTNKIPIPIGPEPATRLCRSTSFDDENYGKRFSSTAAPPEPSVSSPIDAENLFQGLEDWRAASSASCFFSCLPSGSTRDDHARVDRGARSTPAHQHSGSITVESPCPPLEEDARGQDETLHQGPILCGRVVRSCDKWELAGSVASTAAHTPGSTPIPKSMAATPQPEHLMAMNLEALHKPLIDLRSIDTPLMDL